MKWCFLRGLVATVAMSGLTAGVGPAAMAANGNDVAVELEPVQLSEHAWYFLGDSSMASVENKGFMSNAGFVVTSDGVVAFDALGTPPLGAAMLRAIARITDQPVRHVIVSHYHADHFYGLQEFREAGIEIWAHTNGQAYLNSEVAEERLAQRRADLNPWVDDKTQLVPADRWLDFAEGSVMPFNMGDSSFQIIDVSGAHSDDDIMLFFEDENVLFAGDLYFTGRIPYVGDADSKQWLTALDRIFDVKPDVVVPGHGPASRDVEQDITLTREYLLYLRQEMGVAADEMMDFDEAYQNTDWSRFEHHPAFEDANRINAYGQYLQMERESLARQ